MNVYYDYNESHFNKHDSEILLYINGVLRETITVYKQ
jgi:hypothetical protein